jgi:hypothetical protein
VLDTLSTTLKAMCRFFTGDEFEDCSIFRLLGEPISSGGELVESQEVED